MLYYEMIWYIWYNIILPVGDSVGDSDHDGESVGSRYESVEK